MCLGIPGRIVDLDTGNPDLAVVDVSGARRTVNIALLVDEVLDTDSWVLIHVGFAMSLIDEAEAKAAMDILATLGEQYSEEMDALLTSRIEDA